jgi:hypothetical protein
VIHAILQLSMDALNGTMPSPASGVNSTVGNATSPALQPPAPIPISAEPSPSPDASQNCVDCGTGGPVSDQSVLIRCACQRLTALFTPVPGHVLAASALRDHRCCVKYAWTVSTLGQVSVPPNSSVCGRAPSINTRALVPAGPCTAKSICTQCTALAGSHSSLTLTD